MLNKSFDTIDEGFQYISDLVASGMKFQECRIANDFIKPKKTKQFKLLGVDKSTESFCKKISPGGKWNIEIEEPGTMFITNNGRMQIVKNCHYCASAWYSKYLPYAYGMVMAEYDFKKRGIDFRSINSYYGSVIGFVSLGRGEANQPDCLWNRIDPEDTKLYTKIFNASLKISYPTLPFDEAYIPALVYTACFLPEVAYDYCGEGWKLVCSILEEIGRPRPVVRYKYA